MHNPERDLPEGVINADPAGGWEDGRMADAQTQERSDAQGTEDLESAVTTDGWVADIPPAENATDVGPVEGDEPTQGTDPDLASDQDAGSRDSSGATTEEK